MADRRVISYFKVKEQNNPVEIDEIYISRKRQKMDNKVDIDFELSKLREILGEKHQISTIDLAFVYDLCDKYIKNKLGVDILSIFEKVDSPTEDISRYILFKLLEEPKIARFIESYGLYDLLGTTIYFIGDKKIIKITDNVIQNSNKRPSQMNVPTDENQIHRIFEALRKNYYLYEQLYKDKVWLINSTDSNKNTIGQARIKISPYMFFHLMGFDYANILNPNGKDRNGNSNEKNASEFSAIFPDSNYAYSLLQNFGKNQITQYMFVELLLSNEERFLQAALDGKLRNTINVDKIEMKCFSFERMGAVQNASGMVFFDKKKAISLGYESSIQHINTDIILLNDFIRKYDLQHIFGLDFVISPFDKLKNRQISDQQSIFLTKQAGGGLNSGVLNGQIASVSSSAVGYRENDFNYEIIEQAEAGGVIVNPASEPIMSTEFGEEERRRVAQTIKEGIPELNLTYLDDLTYGNNKKK